MTSSPGSIAPFYAGWEVYNERIIEVVRDMDDEQLAIRPAAERWPIWATVAHTAGTRVYWLCGVLGEPGADTTPFSDPMSGLGWEDDLDTPRSAAELVGALESTWRVVAGCLERWTPDMLGVEFTRIGGDGHEQRHTRQSVLMRMLTHDAYHAGELSQTLGIFHLPQIDLWRIDPESEPTG